MKITAEVRVRLERADGSMTEVAESAVLDYGDNPRYDVATCTDAIGVATEQVLAGVRAGRTNQLSGGMPLTNIDV